MAKQILKSAIPKQFINVDLGQPNTVQSIHQYSPRKIYSCNPPLPGIKERGVWI